MSSEEAINKQLVELQEETEKTERELQAHMRNKMAPIWNKRRDIVKQIPNFWTRVIENAPFMMEHENDIEALGNLVDFHVEFDEKRPDYRKVIATYKKNDVFKNETLTKEFIVDDDNQGEVISKSTIDYHPGREPKKSNKRKADDDEDDDDFNTSLLDWYTNDDLIMGKILADDIFVNAMDYFNVDDDEEEDDEEGKEYSLGESDEDEEDEEPSKKKAKK
ncbi:hypothetical protein O0I10_009267 [Lichtheimia ornata]|uniref:Nucleosome assembly protein n=1 Tax=Lichtheimia ornata TaxID=688661 RepID=A0AAD7UXF9_9FUNG|nr:uncharacterized protein O0I10_009267 [Lichtheimia ornata]KAJ8655060.1 hypothetical protein O0I10_009267 [Lichtheimia ornata]